MADLRATVRQRAQEFLGTPYEWGGTTKQGIDCSAFISQVWGVPRQTTDTLDKVAQPISKDELEPGDALNLPTWNDPRGYGHVRLFDGWADAEHTRMRVYESSSATNGVVHRVIPYDPKYQPMRPQSGTLGTSGGGPKVQASVTRESLASGTGYDWTQRIAELNQRKTEALARLNAAETEWNTAAASTGGAAPAAGGANAETGLLPTPGGGGTGSTPAERRVQRADADYNAAKAAFEKADKDLNEAQMEASKAGQAPPPTHVPAPPDQPYIVYSDGTAIPNKNYQGPPPTAPKAVQGEDGKYYIIDPKDPTKATPVQGIPGKDPGYVTVGRRVYRPNANGGLDLVVDLPQDAPQRAPQYPSEEALQNAQTDESRARAEEIRQKNLGTASLAWQNHLRLIDQIQQMHPGSPGGISVEEAQKYISLSQRNLEAALKGTTAFDVEKQAQDDKRARQTIGSSILNQRLSSGAGLASSLTSSAFGSDVMMPAGKSSLGYAPAALAVALTDKLGGGQDVSDFAKNLLMGAQGGADPGWPGV